MKVSKVRASTARKSYSSFEGRSGAARSLFVPKSLARMCSLLGEENPNGNGHSPVSPIHQSRPRSESSDTAEFPARATTARGPSANWARSPELWFPYAPITEPSTVMFAPAAQPRCRPDRRCRRRRRLCLVYVPRKQSPWGIFGP